MRNDNDVYNRILEIAYQLFEEKGYEATTTREIAEMAGISRGHLRYYFTKKEELFFSYFAAMRDKRWAETKREYQAVEDPVIFALILLEAYTSLICSFRSKRDLETLQGYQIVSKYERKSDVFTEQICNFAAAQKLDVDLQLISSSVEIAEIILFKFAFDLQTPNRSHLTVTQIWNTAARHGLFRYGIEPEDIEKQIAAAINYMKKTEKE